MCYGCSNDSATTTDAPSGESALEAHEQGGSFFCRAANNSMATKTKQTHEQRRASDVASGDMVSPTSARLDRKKAFIRQLASFLVEGQAAKGICLQMDAARPANGMPRFATEWAALRGATPLFGYPTVEEAIEQLTDFLG